MCHINLPIANTLIAFALPAHAPANDIIRAIYLDFHEFDCCCKNTNDIGAPIL